MTNGFDPVTGQALPPGPAAYRPSTRTPRRPRPATCLLDMQDLLIRRVATRRLIFRRAMGCPGLRATAGPVGYQVPAGYQIVPMYPARPPKPGGAVAAAVLGYVQAGFVLIGGIVAVTGAAGFEASTPGSAAS